MNISGRCHELQHREVEKTFGATEKFYQPMHSHRPGTTINTTLLWCACKHLCNQANICADRCVCKSNCYLHTRNPWISAQKHQKVQGAGKIAKQIFMAAHLHFVHSIAWHQSQLMWITRRQPYVTKAHRRSQETPQTDGQPVFCTRKTCKHK